MNIFFILDEKSSIFILIVVIVTTRILIYRLFYIGSVLFAISVHLYINVQNIVFPTQEFPRVLEFRAAAMCLRYYH